MTPRDECLFAQGMLLGAALAYAELRPALDELTERLGHVEHNLRPPPRVPRVRLRPAGWRGGQRLYQIAGRYG